MSGNSSTIFSYSFYYNRIPEDCQVQCQAFDFCSEYDRYPLASAPKIILPTKVLGGYADHLYSFCDLMIREESGKI
jgi:hypothetical protein